MNRNTRTGLIAGIALFILASAPFALLLIAIESGAVGTVSTPGLITMAFLIIAALAAGAGFRLTGMLDEADGAAGRSRVDAWVAFYALAAVIVVGTFIIPVGTLAIMVNSDRALQDSGWWFFGWWTLLHLLLAGVAFGLARLAFGRSRAAGAG